MTIEEFILKVSLDEIDSSKVYAVYPWALTPDGSRKTGSMICVYDAAADPNNHNHSLATFSWGDRQYLIVDDNGMCKHYRNLPCAGKDASWIGTGGERLEDVRVPWSRDFMGGIPTSLIERLGIRSSLLNPFRVNGYHGNAMRTNEGMVVSQNFRMMPGESTTDKDFTFLGIELEICGDDYQTKLDDFFCAKENKDIFDSFDVSEDGSIRGYGLELVSIPMSLNYLRANIPLFAKLYGWINKSKLTSSGSSMHIHFDNGLFDCSDAPRFSSIITAFWRGRNEGELLRLSQIVGRSQTTYCAVSNDFGSAGHDHHNWVSHGDRTTEFRRYSANLNEKDLLNKIDFTVLTIKAIRDGIDAGLSNDVIVAQLAIILQERWIEKQKIVKEAASNPLGCPPYKGIYYWWGSALDSLDDAEEELSARKERIMALLSSPAKKPTRHKAAALPF